jgi:hypothetical protein
LAGLDPPAPGVPPLRTRLLSRAEGSASAAARPFAVIMLKLPISGSEVDARDFRFTEPEPTPCDCDAGFGDFIVDSDVFLAAFEGVFVRLVLLL